MSALHELRMYRPFQRHELDYDHLTQVLMNHPNVLNPTQAMHITMAVGHAESEENHLTRDCQSSYRFYSRTCLSPRCVATWIISSLQVSRDDPWNRLQ
jgi:hypothetical protein